MATHPLIEILKQPWSASTLTPDQEQRKADVARAKELWTAILGEFREAHWTRTKARRYNLRSMQPFFPLFELPSEIRNIIYDYHLDNEREARNPPMKRFPSYHSKWYAMLSSFERRVLAIRASEPTSERESREEDRKQQLKIIVTKRLAQAQSSKRGLTPGAHEILEEYKQEHEMCTEWINRKVVETGSLSGKSLPENRSILDEDGSGDEKKLIMVVDPRGNILDDIPILSLVNRRLFSETFFLFYSLPREGFWVKWIVRNLDFFPFLRLYQSLTFGTYPIEIPPSRLHIELDSELEGLDPLLYTRKFKQVQRLVELHWLQGVPLWGCFTGLSDHQDCKGPFGDYMYSVRQIVALYRIDHDEWRRISIDYLCRYELIWNGRASSNDSIEDPKLVEHMIHILCEAMKFSLGYECEYSRVDRNGETWSEDLLEPFRVMRNHRQVVATEKENATVDIMDEYRDVMDTELRERLGEAYDEWERLADDAEIPAGVIL